MPPEDAILCCSSSTPSYKSCWIKNVRVQPPWPYPVPAGLGVEKAVTLSPLGIRRNMSGITHNPGTTPAGNALCADLCMHPARQTPHVAPGSAIARTYCVTGLYTTNGRSRRGEKKNMAAMDSAAPGYSWPSKIQHHVEAGSAKSGSPQPAVVTSPSHLPPPSPKMKTIKSQAMWVPAAALRMVYLEWGKESGSWCRRVGQGSAASWARIEVVFRPSNSPRG